jgi:alkylation response protein AidB-like acyl-CoA dehydrogenase
VVFGRPIGEYQMIQKKLADMAVEIEAARLLARRCAQALDEGRRGRVEASMAKLYASDVAQRAATEAVQIQGAYGASGENRVSRCYRDAKVFQIVEGTNEIQRRLIAENLLGSRNDS